MSRSRKKRGFSPASKKPNKERVGATTRGTITVHPRGFGFVSVKGGEDIFIPKQHLKGAVDGDLVEAEVDPIVSAKGPEGKVIAILERSRTHLASTLLDQVSSTRFMAYSPLLGPKRTIFIDVEKKKSLSIGERVISFVTNWHGENDSVEARYERTIGHIEDPLLDIEAAIEEFELLSTFSKEAIEEAKAFGKSVELDPKRLDLTAKEVVTIDPDTAKDFDDAISLTEDENGHFHLGVHIADVAAYVRPGSALDKEALSRCNSTYFPGKCVPMLPEALSNELCSLKPHVKRYTVSVLGEFDPRGKLLSYQIKRAVIESKHRFSYGEALEALEGKLKTPYLPLLQRMCKLALLFKEQRKERGSIELNVTSSQLKIDETGIPTHIHREEYDITHQMIEEFMLKANELVAIHLGKTVPSLIYRVHEEPASDAFDDFFQLARALNLIVPPKPEQKDIQKILLQAKGTLLEGQLTTAFIRSMRLAAYSEENIGHYGLALEHYCHFTSPIRRYSDLIIERLLFQEIPPHLDLQPIAALCSSKERVSFRAEQSVLLLKKLRLAKKHYDEDPEKKYPALVTRVRPFGISFEIPAFDLEGSIHVSELGSDYFEFDAGRLQFKGKKRGKIFTLGTLLEVEIEKLDLIRQASTWRLAK